MARFRVTVTRSEVHFVDAVTFTAASSEGLKLATYRVRPAYNLDPTADVEELAADEQPVAKMRRRVAMAHAETERVQ